MSEVFFQIVGWAGAVMVVLAYVLVTYKKVDGGSALYPTLNLLGCIGVAVNAFHQAAWPSLGIQIIWAIVALLGFVNIYRK